MKRFRWLVETADDGTTVQHVLHHAAGLSHARVKGIIAAGLVTLNGDPATKPDVRVRAGDRIEAAFDPERRYRAPSPAPRGGAGFRILHQDDDIVVVEKDAGVLTVPTPQHEDDTLVQRVEATYRKRGFRARDLWVVHRIDRTTSGLVVFARNRIARERLKDAFARRLPDRIYLALVEGRLARDEGSLRHRLREDPVSLKVRVALAGEAGREALCRYRVIERFAHAALVEIALVTGRRNQIRVQFAAEGHPIVGDTAYGAPSPLIGRTALHAHRLSFEAPSGRGLVSFESKVPADFRRAVSALRRGAGARQSATRTRTPV